jgi:hypothetical protein
MYVIREHGLTTIDGEKRCCYFIPGGPFMWASRKEGEDPPVDAAIRTAEEAHKLYPVAARDYEARFRAKPRCLEIVGCQYHLI